MHNYIEISTGETFVGNTEIMSRLNSTFSFKSGAVGTVINFKLLDEFKSPVNLSNALITITARKGRQRTVIDDLPCMTSGNPTAASIGVGLFVFDDEAAEIKRGTYSLEFKLTDQTTGAVRYFPTSSKTPYAQLKVEDALN